MLQNIIFFSEKSGWLLLSVVVGLYAFSRLNFFYRLMVIQAVIALISDIVGFVTMRYQQVLNIDPNNHFSYNVYILLEAMILIGASTLYFSELKPRLLIGIGFLVFTAAFLLQMLNHGIWRFANVAFIVECIVVVIIYLVILYRSATSPQFSFKASAELWLCLGLCIYCSANTPLLGAIHYLNKHYLSLSESLFRTITNNLGNIRYLFLMISFLQAFRQHSLITGKV